MLPVVIQIGTAGQVKGMHRDEFPLSFLGKQSIKRASEIMHDPDTQRWYISVPKKGVFMRVYTCGEFDSYGSARDFEVEWMNACLAAQAEPLSVKGLRLAERLAATPSWRKKGGGKKK